MPVELSKYLDYEYCWGLSHNDSHRMYRNVNEIYDLSLGSTTPPTVLQYACFSVHQESSATISTSASGNNCYPASTTLGYYNAQAIYEDESDRSFLWGDSGFTLTNASTYYLACSGAEDVSSTSKGMGSYNATTETPSYDKSKGGWYNSNGKVLGEFESDTSGNVSNLKLYRNVRKGHVTYITSDHTVTAYDENLIVDASLIGSLDITLNSSNLYGQEIRIKKINTEGNINLYGIIDNSTLIQLISDKDNITLVCGSTQWYSLGLGKIIINSGWISYSSWTGKTIGQVSLVYDNYSSASGIHIDGENILCYSTASTTVVNQGIIFTSTGSTDTFMMRDVVCTTNVVFPNNYIIEGEISGFTALVSGTIKNTNSSFVHNFGDNDFKVELHYNFTNPSYSGSLRIEPSNLCYTAANTGVGLWKTDSNTFHYKSHPNGMCVMLSNSTVTALATADSYYNIKVERKI